MKRFLAIVALCVLLAPVLLARRRSVGPVVPAAVPLGEPFAGISASERALFDAGKVEFEQLEDVASGLGPVFNSRACSECHLFGAIGGGSERMVTRIGRTVDGKFDPLTQFGGSLLQARSIGKLDDVPFDFQPELVPPEATIVTLRRSQPLFGLGLVDATPDSTFIALAAQQAARNDGTAGRVHMVVNPLAGGLTVGKFGWKSQIATLFEFSGEAYLNEMGITSPGFPDENCPSGHCSELQFNPAPGINDSGKGVQALADFMTLLGAPLRGPITTEVIAGEEVFNRIGCNACHVSSLQTGYHPNPVFNRMTYQPFSDFLLHDMGTLGDGIEQGSATGRELRTAPLWGLRMITMFLHDARAKTIEEAIVAHEGQGRASRDGFNELTAGERAKLLAFLKSL